MDGLYGARSAAVSLSIYLSIPFAQARFPWPPPATSAALVALLKFAQSTVHVRVHTGCVTLTGTRTRDITTVKAAGDCRIEGDWLLLEFQGGIAFRFNAW